MKIKHRIAHIITNYTLQEMAYLKMKTKKPLKS
ncbi:hypothetical protein M2373_000683 [Chryseobacterium sp. JUb7]|nr:hypothetical protein [Chryseobacterium sp. JUb7]